MRDWLFTPQCAACGAPATPPFCAPCDDTLEPLVDHDPGAPLAPWRYGGALAGAIRRLKFAGKLHVARDLAPLWSPVLAAAVAAHDAIVVPVPLHWRRRAWRGYDQTWLLATHACRDANLAPPIAALRRTRLVPPQSSLPATARRGNVAGTFALARPIADRAIILVDDVATTGTTLAAASAVLREGGARLVVALALTRGE